MTWNRPQIYQHHPIIHWELTSPQTFLTFKSDATCNWFPSGMFHLSGEHGGDPVQRPESIMKPHGTERRTSAWSHEMIINYWPADTRSVSELMCSCSQNERNLSGWFNIEMTTPTEDVFTLLLAGVSKCFDLPTGPVGWRLTEWRPEQFALQLKSELRSADVCGEFSYHSPHDK